MNESLQFDLEGQKVYSVSELNRLARDLLEVNLGHIWLEGEISNYKLYPSGHHYFTLKDEKAEIRAVLFAGAAFGLTFKPESGMQVIAQGKITVYPERGQFQIIVESLKPAGAGKLQLEFEKLKQKLLEEGLFDASRKKPIPQFPESVAIITSSSGAAIRDIISIIERRYPLTSLYVFPVKVQGEGAAQEIAHAIEAANRLRASEGIIDVIITGRGGGSIEDLWAFNEEIVASASANSEVPVISAVGHEVDFTIADFVADLRAPTPSAAAELLVPDLRELHAHCIESVRRMRSHQTERVESLKSRMSLQVSSYAFRRPIQRVQNAQQKLDHLSESLTWGFRRNYSKIRERFSLLLSKLDGANPAAIMKRGYAVAEGPDGTVLRSIEQVEISDKISVKLESGRLKCEILDKELDPS